MNVTPPLLTVAVVALANAGCAAAKPPQPPPTVPGVRSAPPPAWIETRRGDRWLAFSNYCWTVTCIDSRPYPQRSDIPRVTVTRGERVRFHLAFRPSTLSVRLGGKTYALEAARTSPWRVRGATGYAVLRATTADKFRAEYVARLLVR